MKRILLVLFLLSGIFTAKVYGQCNPNFNYSRQGNTLTYSFVNSNNVGNYRYTFNFGPGVVLTGTNNTRTYTFPAPGIYWVCHTIMALDSSCMATTCDSVVVPAVTNCSASFTYSINQNNLLNYSFVASLNDTNYRYKWSFGDGTFSDNRTPSKTYSSGGPKNVCLTVTKKDSSCISTHCDSINVVNGNGCDAGFSVATSPINAFRRIFTPFGTSNVYSFKWVVDSIYTTTNRILEYTFPSAGMHKVCFTVTRLDSSCSNSICIDYMVIGSNCNANWTVTQPNSNPLTRSFTAALNDTNFRYFWTFGDGTSSDSRTPTKTYTSAGKKYVCLKVTRKDSLCTLTKCDSINITLPDSACNSAFTINATNVILGRRFAAAMNSQSYTYTWKFSDSTTFTGPVLERNFQAGTYTVCLTVRKLDSTCVKTTCSTFTVTNANCSSQWTMVKTNSTKTATFTPTLFDTINYNYYWVFGDSTFSYNAKPTKTYQFAGKYRVCLTIAGKNNNCTSTTCDSIAFENISCNANFSWTRSETNDKKVTFNAVLSDTNFRYSWNFFDGTGSDGKNPVKTYTTYGWKKVCLTVTKKDSSCSVTRCDSINLTTNCIANFGFVRNLNIARTYSFEGQNVAGVTYTWNFGDSSATATGRLTQHTFAVPGTYFVTLTINSTGCQASITKQVIVTDSSFYNCQARFESQRIDSFGNVFGKFTNTSYGTYNAIRWNFGNGQGSTGSPETVLFSQAGVYPVCLTVYKIQGNDTLCQNTTCRNFSTLASTSTCRASFSFGTTGQNNYTFTNLSTGTGLVYSWKVNGVQQGSARNFNYTFPSSGMYTVCMRIMKQDSTCVDELCRNILVNQYGTLSTQYQSSFEYQADPSVSGLIQFTNTTSFYTNSSWDFGDGNSSPDNNPGHVYLNSGTYTVCLLSINSRDSVSSMDCRDIWVDRATGIGQNDISLNKIYPNPFQNNLHILMQVKSGKEVRIRLLDISGRELGEWKHQAVKGENEITLETPEIPSGLYFLQIENENERIFRKLMKN